MNEDVDEQCWWLRLVVPSLAGITATFATHPIDTFVVHRMIGSKEMLSLSKLYRGVIPACAQATVIYSCMLGTYEFCRGPLSYTIPLAACVAAIPETLVKGPLETIKNRSQTKKVWPQSLKGRLRLLSLGTLGMLCREVPGNVAYFWTYEYVCRQGYSPMVGGAAAGAAFTGLVYPIDAMRAQFVTGRSILHLRPTYRGVAPYLVRAMAVTSALFSSFQFIADRVGLETHSGKG